VVSGATSRLGRQLVCLIAGDLRSVSGLSRRRRCSAWCQLVGAQPYDVTRCPDTRDIDHLRSQIFAPHEVGLSIDEPWLGDRSGLSSLRGRGAGFGRLERRARRLSLSVNCFSAISGANDAGRRAARSTRRPPLQSGCPFDERTAQVGLVGQEDLLLDVRKKQRGVLLISLICFTTPSKTRADTPLILVVIAVAADVATIGGLIYAVSQNQNDSKTNVNVKVDPPLYAVDNKKGDVNVTVNGNIAPTKTVVLPQDVPQLSTVYPYADIAETTTFSIVGDRLSITTDARNFASVEPTSSGKAHSARIPHVDFDIERIGQTK